MITMNTKRALVTIGLFGSAMFSAVTSDGSPCDLGALGLVLIATLVFSKAFAQKELK